MQLAGFASFGDILSQASLPEVVTTLCLEDRNPLVRAAAFRSLQEMFLVNGIESKLKPEELTVGDFLNNQFAELLIIK